MKKTFIVVFATAAALMLMAVVLLGDSPANAAPVAAPTPAGYNPGDGERRANPINFFSETAITEDQRTSCFEVINSDVVDLHTIIDHGTVNTTTIKIQYSNDNTNFVDGANVIAASVEDANVMNQYPLFGRYVCLYADVTSSDTITLTAIGIAK